MLLCSLSIVCNYAVRNDAYWSDYLVISNLSLIAISHFDLLSRGMPGLRGMLSLYPRVRKLLDRFESNKYTICAFRKDFAGHISSYYAKAFGVISVLQIWTKKRKKI
jgi:hypothetical protein